MLLLWSLISMVLRSEGAACGSKYPPLCECDYDSHKKVRSVNCTDAGLTEFPDLDVSVRTLWVSDFGEFWHVFVPIFLTNTSLIITISCTDFGMHFHSNTLSIGTILHALKFFLCTSIYIVSHHFFWLINHFSLTLIHAIWIMLTATMTPPTVLSNLDFECV